MKYLRYAFWLAFGTVAVDLFWWSDSLTWRALQGFENWNDHLYGHWEWWVVLLDFWSTVLFAVAVGVGGFIFGSIHRRAGDKLPDRIEKYLEKIQNLDMEKPDDSDMPSRTYMIVTGIIVSVGFSWYLVHDKVLQ